MEWFLVTADMYRRALMRSLALGIRNWPVLATAFVYAAITMAAAWVAIPLGMLGGFVLSFVLAACGSSFLYLIEMIVRTSKVTIADFQRSFTAYLWDVMGVAFIVWLFFSLALPALAQLPQGLVLLLFIQLVGFVFFNAVPELIYLGHYSSLGLLSESYRFVSANWLEWLPLALLTAVIYAVMPSPLDLSAGLGGLVLIPLFYLLMVMRGFLFIDLHGSTYRSRRFKYRMGT